MRHIIPWLAVAAFVLDACAKPAQYPGYCYDVKLFTAAVLSCTDQSATREQSRACKRDLNTSCGVVETVSVNAHE